MADFNDELLRGIAIELLVAVDSHPSWITEDDQLRQAVRRLETERLLTPQVLAALLVPILRSQIRPDELEHLAALLEAGEVEQLTSALRTVIARYAREQGIDLDGGETTG